MNGYSLVPHPIILILAHFFWDARGFPHAECSNLYRRHQSTSQVQYLFLDSSQSIPLLTYTRLRGTAVLSPSPSLLPPKFKMATGATRDSSKQLNDTFSFRKKVGLSPSTSVLNTWLTTSQHIAYHALPSVHWNPDSAWIIRSAYECRQDRYDGEG